jgi:hypothetical protein
VAERKGASERSAVKKQRSPIALFASTPLRGLRLMGFYIYAKINISQRLQVKQHS